MKHRRVAQTEDRIKTRAAVCTYQQCQGPISPALVADGWTYCSEECYYDALMEEREPEPDEDDNE